MSYPFLIDVLGDTNNVFAWDDLRGPSSGINPVGSPSPATPNTSDGSLTFGKGNVAVAWFQMPHNWKIGSEINIHIHWSKSTTNAGTVNWQVKYKWGNIGEVMPGFSVLTSLTSKVSSANTVDLHALDELGMISGAGKTLSSMICVFLQRTNDGNDTFTGNANLYEIDIHYQINSMGSREEYIK